MTDQLISETECKIIKAQMERRAKYRKEFLRMRTDPCKHSMEAGYVFDPALQRFMSMKACQFDHFQANPRTVISGITMLVLPMLVYGYCVYKQRSQFERDCRCGKILPRDRIFKLK
ncbi:unnamed protein product [Parnassius mnemosyne]|uniref:NADH dehydrogenase [ubiquinone] 1 beta subcomplex subunit 4 n=1 Tax=Parnassius mnemosyne TaxID=213953 RepID=A0AAV1KRK1_9NEOP